MTRAVAEPGSSDLPSRDSDNKNRVKHPAYPNVDAGLSMPEGVPDKLLAFRDLRTIGDVQVAHTGYLPGEMEVPPLRGYAVNLLLSGSGSLVTKLGDKTWKGPQIAGSVEVFSGNTHQERALDGSISESVNVLLDESIVKRAANEVGVELAQLEILDSLHARDPQVGQLLLSFLSEVKSDSLGGELYTQSLATALAVHLLREHSSLGSGRKRNSTTDSIKGVKRVVSRHGRSKPPPTTSAITSPPKSHSRESPVKPISPNATSQGYSKSQPASRLTST